MSGTSLTGDLTSDSLQMIENGNQSIIDNIKQLQTMEQDLYNEVQVLSATPGNDDKQNTLIARINQLSQLRISLFASLQQMATTTQATLATSRVDLVDQMTLIGVVEEELNNAKKLMNQTDNIKNNKIRLVEINTYYGKRYRAYTELMKILINVFVPILLIGILQKKELVPFNLGPALIGIILVLGTYFFIKKLMDISKRDNMDFDQYDRTYPTKPTTDYIPEPTATVKTDDSSWNFGFGCVDDSCCSEQMHYDKALRKCVAGAAVTDASGADASGADASGAAASTVTESFVNIIPMPYDESLDILTRTPQMNVVNPFLSYKNYAKY
jgi:hypothetical protein